MHAASVPEEFTYSNVAISSQICLLSHSSVIIRGIRFMFKRENSDPHWPKDHSNPMRFQMVMSIHLVWKYPDCNNRRLVGMATSLIDKGVAHLGQPNQKAELPSFPQSHKMEYSGKSPILHLNTVIKQDSLAPSR